MFSGIFLLLEVKDLTLRVLTIVLRTLNRVFLVWVFIVLTRMQLVTVLTKLNPVPKTTTIILMLVKVPLLLIKMLLLFKVMMKRMNDVINLNQQVHKSQERIYVTY